MMRSIYLFSISSHLDAISVNSLSITFLQSEIDFSKYDAFIITSKQASKALQQYKKELFQDIPALCISKASAKSYEEIGGRILDIGKGYGDNLVEKIKNYPKSKRWLYLRAKVVASDFVSVCQKDAYSIDEATVYMSECSKNILNVNTEDNAILIFTSPSSLECFLKTHVLSQSNTIIVIGKTTAKAVPKGFEYCISEKTTIESCMELAKNILKSKEC